MTEEFTSGCLTEFIENTTKRNIQPFKVFSYTFCLSKQVCSIKTIENFPSTTTQKDFVLAII